MTTASTRDPDLFADLKAALIRAGFRGETEVDTALRAAMSTDNSVYQIRPDIIVAPQDSGDVVTLMKVLDRPEFAQVPLTPRGGGTGTNGQSLNAGIILDMRRHMHRLLEVDVANGWAEVEPGIVLDDLNEQLRPHGVFFAPETSTSSRCTVGGMVSTDASGKGSRIYGKTSDNLIGVEIARAQGLCASFEPIPDWAIPMLRSAQAAARAGRDAFIANTPRLNRRYTGYDLERACPGDQTFEWWRLVPGSEGTLGPLTRLRLKLWPLPTEKRLVVAGFASFRDSVAASVPLLDCEPTAVEVMDERVQALAEDAGLLNLLPSGLRPRQGEAIAYTFVEITGNDAAQVDAKVASCAEILRGLPGIKSVHIAEDLAEIRDLWAIRSAGVGLLGKVTGRRRPIAFVEDCVVPPEELAPFLDGFLGILNAHGLNFGIYGHVDVGCLHIRPALDVDDSTDREKLVAVSDEIFALVRSHNGIFWGEHGKGVRGAYLRDWIGPEAYSALQGIKAAFDPAERFNPGKLVTLDRPMMGIADTPFRAFNTAAGDPLQKAFACNGNAQCLSYSATTPMCPSFKATGDVRHSPKGRADALRAWNRARLRPGDDARIDEADLVGVLDTCLGCKACASSCPVQVDIPTMRAAFFRDYYSRTRRPVGDLALLWAERFSPVLYRLAPLARPIWPLASMIGERLLGFTDMPRKLARGFDLRPLKMEDLARADLPPNTVLILHDWFSALFDGETQQAVIRGLTALGYAPRLLEMRPSGKIAHDLGDHSHAARMADDLARQLDQVTSTEFPIIGYEPAFVMALRQDILRDRPSAARVLLPQEFLKDEIARGRTFPKVAQRRVLTLFTHCTESTALPDSRSDWRAVLAAIGVSAQTPATGCCGMAGVFGHKRRHQSMSKKLYALSWKKPVAEAKQIAMTGFSCRCQAKRLGGVVAEHPLGVIADALAPREHKA